MRLLVVEDEPKLAQYIHRGLTEESFIVDVARDGEEALERAARTKYDLVILDLMLPRMDGFAVCRALRASGSDLPILILSARRIVDDRVKGLELGADDYLTKPFAFSELSARVRALLRRRQPATLLALSVGTLTLDPITRIVKRGDRRIDLTQREFALLDYLMRHAGHVVTRTMIAEHVWGFNWDRLTNVIDVYINHIRRKIERAEEPRLIHAVRGAGYVIREPDSESS
jgi:DNA-binding response OmpR family regulator